MATHDATTALPLRDLGEGRRRPPRSGCVPIALSSCLQPLHRGVGYSAPLRGL